MTKSTKPHCIVVIGGPSSGRRQHVQKISRSVDMSLLRCASGQTYRQARRNTGGGFITTAYITRRSCNALCSNYMAALWNRAGHYIFVLWFLLLSIFYLFSSPNLSRRRFDVCHTPTHGVALVRI